jgi:hypothetical protein
MITTKYSIEFVRISGLIQNMFWDSCWYFAGNSESIFTVNACFLNFALLGSPDLASKTKAPRSGKGIHKRKQQSFNPGLARANARPGGTR